MEIVREIIANCAKIWLISFCCISVILMISNPHEAWAPNPPRSSQTFWNEYIRIIYCITGDMLTGADYLYRPPTGTAVGGPVPLCGAGNDPTAPGHSGYQINLIRSLG